MTGSGTNTYVLGSDDLVLIDPGPNDQSHLDAIESYCGDRLRYILVSHHHSDHAPAAAPLAGRTGAMLLAHGYPDLVLPDAPLEDGDLVAVRGWRLRTLFTPGHASDHLCFVARPDDGDDGGGDLLFSGDQVMEGSTVVVAPLDGDMSAYLASLSALQMLDPPIAAIAPGHGEVISEPHKVLAEYVAHRLEREAAVEAALSDGPTTAEALVAVIYGPIDPRLVRPASRSVWAHLRKLAIEGRAVTADADDVSSRWWAPGREVERSATTDA